MSKINIWNNSIIFFILLSIVLYIQPVISTEYQNKEDILRALPKQDSLQFKMAASSDNNWEVDPNSFSNVNNFKVNHIKLNLKTEFERKALTGYVINEVEIIDNSVNEFILDTRGLKIFSASWLKDDGKEISLDVSSIKRN